MCGENLTILNKIVRWITAPVSAGLFLLLCELLCVFLCVFWQFGAKLARVQSTAQWSQQQQQHQQHGSSLLPQSVFKRVSSSHMTIHSTASVFIIEVTLQS